MHTRIQFDKKGMNHWSSYSTRSHVVTMAIMIVAVILALAIFTAVS